MKKKVVIPILILVVAILFLIVMVKTRPKSPEVKVEETVWRVEQSEIKKQSLSPYITLYGQVETANLYNASAPALGQVAQVLVKEGEFVEQGQLMLSLDKADFEPLLNQAQGKVDELQAQIKSEQLRHEVNIQSLKNEKQLLKLSEKALARTEKVKKRKLGSISETEQAMQQVERQRLAVNSMQFSVNEHPARLKQLNARLLQAQADLQKQQLAFQRSQVYAPFTGIVAQVNVAQGDRVNTNEKLMSFYSLSDLDIRAKIPLHLLSEFQNNLSDGVHLKGVVTNSKEHLAVRLERLSGQGQASGVDAIFSITSNNFATGPSSTGRAQVRLGSIVVLRLQRVAQDNLIAVPYESMYGSDKVYKIVDSRLQPVNVETIGEFYNTNQKSDAADFQILIRSQLLNDGDKILATHLPNAYTGLKVGIVNSNEQ